MKPCILLTPTSVVIPLWLEHTLTYEQDREATRANDSEPPATNTQDTTMVSNEKLRSFFSGLVNKGPTNGPRGA